MLQSDSHFHLLVPYMHSVHTQRSELEKCENCSFCLDDIYRNKADKWQNDFKQRFSKYSTSSTDQFIRLYINFGWEITPQRSFNVIMVCKSIELTLQKEALKINIWIQRQQVNVQNLIV